jgi:lipopolysaccharide transport system permease protein
MHEAVQRESQWLENRPRGRWLPKVDLRELWFYRELALSLALRDLKVRYKQTALGVAWAVIQPLAGALIFSVVFGRLAKLPSDDIDYPVFVYAGLVVWLYFSGAIDAAAQSLIEHRDLVTKTYFPRVLAPFSAVLPGLLDFALSLLLLGAFMLVYGVSPAPAVVLLPLWTVALVLVALAGGLWLSALNALYRDVRYAVPFLIQLWLFASPVVYPSSLVEGGWRYLYAANPMAGLLDGFRWSLIGGPGPGREDLVSLGVCLALLAGGALYFQAVERELVDRI